MDTQAARVGISGSYGGLNLGDGGILYHRDVELYLREVALAHEVGVPVVVYAISAGPLTDPSKRKLVAQHLNPVAGVCAAPAACRDARPPDVPAADVQIELLRQGADLGAHTKAMHSEAGV